MSANGLAMGPVLKLGDLTADKRPLQVERDGTPVTLWGYVDGPRCPGYVKAGVSKARGAYYDATTTVETNEDGVRTEHFTNDPLAWDAFLRDVLLVVVDGLTYAEAEVLSGQTETAMTILRTLSWVRSEQAEDDPKGEAEGERSTTESSSRNSPPATGSRRRRS